MVTNTLESVSPSTGSDILDLTTEIVASHLSSNQLATEEIPHLIRLVFDTLNSIRGSAGSLRYSQLHGQKSPAVPISESVHPDYIVCLEDGKHLQVLKRHLKTAFGMTIEEYKKRWGLGPDYPTVAPNYSKRRSSIAKDTGLGNTPKRRRAKIANAA